MSYGWSSRITWAMSRQSYSVLVFESSSRHSTVNDIPAPVRNGSPKSDGDLNPATSSQLPLSERRVPVAPYIPATRSHPSDAFTGYSEPLDPERPLVSIRGLYSSTQFDTLSVLSRVYTRPNPKIELGPIDDSVSFVVVDSTKPDLPIVYCSQNFYKLTGYKPQEIVGRNCVSLYLDRPQFIYHTSCSLCQPSNDLSPSELTIPSLLRSFSLYSTALSSISSVGYC